MKLLTRDRIQIGVKLKSIIASLHPCNIIKGEYTVCGKPFFDIQWRDGSISSYSADKDLSDFRIIDDEVFSNIRQEKACRACQHKNDIGVNSCWWCGNQP